MEYTIYIDGQEGTTGLQLRQKLEKHPYVKLLLISAELRKDSKERQRLMNLADIVFLCLPDQGAKEAVALVENPKVCIIDASTAHRTNPNWVYGFPELSQVHRKNIKDSKRITNPGCHATGFISAVYPLISMGIVGSEYPFVAHSITGYSGGGKAMIGEYEQEALTIELQSPRQYGLNQNHKHLGEMQQVTGINEPPIFCPIVSNFYGGLATTIPLQSSLFHKKTTKKDLFELLTAFYKDSNFITVAQMDQAFLPSNELVGTNDLILYLEGNDERMTLTAVLDNLGKGASGAAIQNMNIVLGLDETIGL